MSYRIKPGDTLSALAARYNTTVDALAKANNIQNVDLIYAGATLKIPGETYTTDTFQSQATQKSSARARTTGSAPTGAASSVNGSEFGSNAARLAASARSVATRMNTTGWCAKGVGDALDAAGLSVPRQPSAYLYADVLARDPRFREVRLTDEQIRQLPPGAIVVSDKYNSPTNPHGHISVTLGNGMEASDHVQSQLLIGTQRVFIPR
jgi:LysM repeat protein